MSNLKNAVYLHGVFFEIFGQGVLLCGPSGSGKSEAALGLLDRGHQLVADDIILFEMIGTHIQGSCPDKIQDLLEIRGFGIVNVRELWGDAAIKKNAFLNLMIVFDLKTPESIVKPDYKYETVLGASIPTLHVAALPSRPLALLLETIVQYHQHHS